MEKKKTTKFKCKNCQKTVEKTNFENRAPECCDMPMEKMEAPPPCQMSETAEHARSNEISEPCDDGREGKI